MKDWPFICAVVAMRLNPAHSLLVFEGPKMRILCVPSESKTQFVTYNSKRFIKLAPVLICCLSARHMKDLCWETLYCNARSWRLFMKACNRILKLISGRFLKWNGNSSRTSCTWNNYNAVLVTYCLVHGAPRSIYCYARRLNKYFY